MTTAIEATGIFSAYSFMAQGLSWEGLLQVVVAVLPAWLFGAFVGYLLPRPKWFSSNKSGAALVFGTPPGSGIRRLALIYHLVVICRDVWCHFTAPGTFRAWLRRLAGKPSDQLASGYASTVNGPSPAQYDSWYVTEKDLAFFQHRVEQDGEIPGASNWELMLDKHIDRRLKYQAWRRTLPDGKTEYKSVTISFDSTAEEIMDIYLDDDFRPQWDTMVVEHDVLEHGDFSQRQQVVRWLRKFPFSFLSAREYVIGRRAFSLGKTLYGISKVIDSHPRSPCGSRHVSMDVFWSMWRCRTVPCPWGTGAPACETTLLHHEQFKIPENLARFAVRHGMWGFVRCMADHVPQFVAARRQRCAPSGADPQAYGANCAPNPPGGGGASGAGLPNSRSSASLTSMGSGALCGSECGSDGSSMLDGSQCSNESAGSGRRMARVAAVLLASGVALMLNKGSSKRLRGHQHKAYRRHRRHSGSAAD